MKPKAAESATHPDRMRYLRWIAAGMAITLALLLGLSWPAFAARFGPMHGEFSQCQICARHRNMEVVCGRKVKDEITTTKDSDWIDTFVPPSHQHVWQVISSASRRAWFDGGEIACGKGGPLSVICSRRAQLGEDTCRQLVLRFHELVRHPAPAMDRYKQYDEFARAVSDDPGSLLTSGAETEPEG